MCFQPVLIWFIFKNSGQNSLNENIEDSELIKDLFLTIYNSSKTVIAQVEGHAIAGGCGLISVCDMVFAVPEAKFWLYRGKNWVYTCFGSCFSFA